MKDADLEAYVQAIEGHFRARRGADHVLSPRDFGLARSWYRAGIPLATVLVGMDRAFELAGNATSLAFCQRNIQDLVAAGPAPRSTPAPPAESLPLRDLKDVLEALRERLLELRPGPEACFEPPLQKVCEVHDLVAVASRPNWGYLRGKLREIDDEVSAAVLYALPPVERAALRAEAARAAERHRGRVDEAALNDAVARYELYRARERWGLPRVSVV